MPRLAALTLAAYLLSACSPSAPSAPSAQWESGSRLRARIQRAPDGTARFSGWHDTLLDVDCAFAPDTGGTIRCLPTTVLDPIYLDASCGRLAHRTSACGAAPSFATLSGTGTPDACGSVGPLGAPLEVHALDASAATTAPYWLGPPAACGLAALPPSSLVADLGVSDPSIFVDATLEREPLVGRLAADVLVASDGARQRVALFDTTLDERCTPSETGVLGVDACLPWERIGYVDVIPWRSDAACSHVIGHGGADTCPPIALMQMIRADACTVHNELHAVGTAVAQPVYEGRDGTQCTVVAERPTEQWYELGPPLGDDVLARTTTEQRGSGALQARVSTLDGVELGFLAWQDASGTTCSETRFADGTMRCMPPTENVDAPYRFGDAACTEPVFGGSPCGNAAFGVHTTTTACGELPSGVVALEPATGAAAFVRDGTGACTPDTTPNLGPLTRVGASVPLGGFPALETVIE